MDVAGSSETRLDIYMRHKAQKPQFSYLRVRACMAVVACLKKVNTIRGITEPFDIIWREI